MNEQVHPVFQNIFQKHFPQVFDPKDPEEQERFKNSPDGYPDSFKSEYDQQTSDNQTNYKRQ